MNRPLTVGITGGIGSGKSVVCQIFSLLGIPIYNADRQARLLTVTHAAAIRDIKSAFGEEAFLADGTLNRALVAKIAFQNPLKLQTLNSIIHPLVERDFQHWRKTNFSTPYIIKEAALLLETGSYRNLDFIITVYSSEEQRIARVLQRDPYRKPEDVSAVMARQTDDEAKFAISHFKVDNTGNKLLIPQVLKIHEFLVNLNQSG